MAKNNIGNAIRSHHLTTPGMTFRICLNFVIIQTRIFKIPGKFGKNYNAVSSEIFV